MLIKYFLFTACPLVVHGRHAVSHVLHSGTDLRRRHDVPGENSAALLAVLRCLCVGQNYVRRASDGVAAAQRVHGNQVLVLFHLADVLCGLDVNDDEYLVLCVQRSVVDLFLEVVAWRSGHHSADTRATVPGESNKLLLILELFKNSFMVTDNR